MSIHKLPERKRLQWKNQTSNTQNGGYVFYVFPFMCYCLLNWEVLFLLDFL